MPIHPCCDNPDCAFCYGSGVAETTPAQEFALTVLAQLAVSDMNTEDARHNVRALFNLVLGNEPVYPPSYGPETLCPRCAIIYFRCDCGQRR